VAIKRIRAFNRFYTQKIGLVTNRFLDSEYTLVQARFLLELNHTQPLYATDFARRFGLSPDYISKVIAKFEAQGLVTRTPSPEDSRKQILSPTAAGRDAYSKLKDRSDAHTAEMIKELTPEETADLLKAMDTIEALLGSNKIHSNLVTLRSHRPGDVGTVIHRHGVLYAREYGFNHEFDAYVALGMARFIEEITERDHLWIAEVEGRFAGSVAIVRRDDETAQLRWLIVEPRDRQKGIGKQLVREAVRFSREQGYEAIILWTIDFLHSARHLYSGAGFQLTETKVSEVWGRTLTEECWKLNLN
jgi:DNA-binding MarR family transcriptional regulator/N-acetylglutamate synthase-like GNAT family acetyltransferase